ncbi:undecaprenyl-phosphate glucose phosphotransferase [Gammaproteobacteria bacterium 53_120_T64]|nr:undecaprenyl-phosphate glucose phosphotransferase [Gammaproteobacteria bacterium 53_120_T64]
MAKVNTSVVSGVSILPVIVDITIMVLTGYVSFFLRFGELSLPPYYHLFIVSASLMTGFTFIAGNSYPHAGSTLRRTLLYFCSRVILAFSIFMLFIVFLKATHMYSRLWLGWWIGLSCLVLFIVHAGYYQLIAQLQARGRMLNKVLIIYGSEQGFETLKNMESSGYVICEALDLQKGNMPLAGLAERVNSSGVAEVWMSMPFSDCANIDEISYELRHTLVNIRFIPQLEDVKLLKHRISYLGSQYAIDLSYTPLDGFNRGVKRLEDVVLATLIGISVIPVCLLIALAIRLSSKGPVLFKQKRHGIGGEKIHVYKFRSMEVHNEQEGVLTQAERDDPRIPPLGHFLRRTSLDELPQFFNVLQGRMSIVGPRPHALVHNEYYKDLVESYMWRHKVKPGITGWAQVNGYRGRTDTLEKMSKRVEHDLWYINNWSLWLDLKIILKSCYKGFFHKNAY